MGKLYYEKFNNLVVAKRSDTFPVEIAEYKRHFHLYYEILFFLSGNVEYTIENKRYNLQKNNLLVIKPTEHHNLKFLDNSVYERYLLQFDETCLNPEVKKILDTFENLYCVLNPNLISLFEKLDLYTTEYKGEKLKLLFESVLSEIIIILSSEHNIEISSPQIVNDQIEKILTYVNSHLGEKLDVETLCKKFYCSKTWLFENFKKSLHSSPNKYVNSKRVALASTLLTQGKRPSDIFSVCGYLDYSTFYRSFLSQVGLTPTDFANKENLTKH